MTLKELLPILIPVAIVLLAAAGFLVRHYFFGGSLVQKATVSHTATQMLSLMKQNGIDVKDIKAVEAYFKGKPSDSLDLAELIVDDQKGELFSDLPSRYQVSAYLGAKADAALNVAEAMLNETELTLSILLSEKENDALNEAQEAFRKYRSAQSEFASSIVSGGSLETTFYLMEAIRLTKLRNDELREEMERRKALES